MRAVAPLPYLYAILDSLRQESRSAADALASPRNLSYSRSSSSVVVAVLVARLPKWFISYDISPKATKERPGDRR